MSYQTISAEADLSEGLKALLHIGGRSLVSEIRRGLPYEAFTELFDTLEMPA